MKNNPKLVAIVGETASGKSSLAVGLAKKFRGEIIAGDSWTVYKGFNIGTAKPDESEMAEVRHHLIDVVKPNEDFTAKHFKDLANGAIAEIVARKHLPILVGGTGLYIDSILFDYSFLPPGSRSEHSRLQSATIPQLLEEISQKGYDLSDIDIRNKRRLVRLLETKGSRPQKSELRSNTLVLGLKISRPQLRKNIETRVEHMFRRGLRHEVRELADRYGWGVEAMKGIGYWEFRDYFEGNASLNETKRKIVRNTLNLAKRQRTWFKRNLGIVWVENLAQADDAVAEFLKKSLPL